MMDPLVSIIIPTFNKWEFTAVCLEQLAKNTGGVPHELIIVDNASTDATRKELARLGRSCRVRLNDTNMGFSAACNQGARMAKGKYLLFLNNDTEPQPGWLEAMVKVVEEYHDVTVVGSRLLFPDGTVQHGGVGLLYANPYPITPVHLSYRRPSEEANAVLAPQAVTAACMLVRSEVFAAVGGFDESYVNGYEDVDFCLKVGEHGGRIAYAPDSVLIHHESVSESRHLKETANLELLQRRWMGKLTTFDYDPFAEEEPTPVDPQRPGVSIVIVAYNSLRTIAPCLESLALHTAPQDEVVLVDNASRDATVQFVELFQERHPGLVTLIRSERNVGFSRGTNLGLEATSKEYVLLLNPDVQVTRNWLDRMLAHLVGDPTVGAVGPTSDSVAGLQKYGLYVKLKPGERPNTKAMAAAFERRQPGQSRETPLLIGFCLLMRSSVLRDMRNLDPELFLGNDDLDLSWRLRQQGLRLLVATDVFVRHFGQASFKSETKVRTAYLVGQSTNALYEKLYRHYEGRVPNAQDLWGMSWFEPQTGLTSVIILVHDNLKLTRECVESVYRHTHRDFELILVDNGSAEDVASYASQLQKSRGNVTYLRNEENLGYAHGCNQGLDAACGQYLVLLNNDVVVTPGWLSRQLALLSLDPSIGVVGPRTNCSAGDQRADGVTYQGLEGLDQFADEWFARHAGEFSFTARVTGVCMVLRREVVERVGGLDTCYGIGNFEDDDFCLRVNRSGLHVVIAGDVFIHHHGSSTFKSMKVDYGRLLQENWRLFRHRWNHSGSIEKGYPAFQLARTRPYDPEWDLVPLRYEEVFHPGVEPLRLDEARPVRLLLVPDWYDRSWRKVLATYVWAFTPQDPVSLIVRVEPPLPELQEQALQEIRAVLSEAGLSDASASDIILETSAIPPARRGGLYTSVTALLQCRGSRAGLYAREARACGLPVVEEVSVAGLRRLAAAPRAAQA